MSYLPFGISIPSDGSNISTTPLSATATYTGTAELSYQPQVSVSCITDQSGTLYFDFSNDGTNWSSFPPSGFTLTAGTHEYHTARKDGRYFRTRLINGSSNQSYLRLYTYFGPTGLPSAPINFTIANDADSIVSKSIISGVGDTNAKVTDHAALQVTMPQEGKTAFGEILFGQLTPVVQLQFAYGILSNLIKIEENQSGTVTASNSMIVCATGAAANSSGTMQSVRFARYQPGFGLRCRFTGMFTTGAANSTQIIGIGTSGEGYFFGYNGTSFGILHRKYGNPEIRTLTISTASTTNENITITLDSDADATVAVTNSGNTTTTANEIAAHDFSDVGRGWDAKAVGSTVVFTSWDSAAHAGTYSISGTTVGGTFAQTLAAAAPTDSWTAQTSWSGDDIFDGNGLTGVTLDPTKGNVFQIDLQYLGFGLIRFYIEDPDDGELHMVHGIEYANANTRPSLNNASLHFYMSAENTSNTTNISLSTGSAGLFIDGKLINEGLNIGVSATKTLGTANETPIVTIRVAETFKNKINRSTIKINLVTCSVEHTKPCAMNFYLNTKLTGASFSSIDSNSTIYKDTSATAFTGGRFLFSIQLGKTGNQVINLLNDLNIGEFSPGDSLTVTLAPTASTGAEGNVSFNINERL